MAGKNKFGTFAGVFTPSILTILGVIMYMRMGWVVGHAGLVGAIIIIVIAHIISISTGLSLSSIATDKKVGAGGIYYILSRSMGIPIGGAIGITLYVGTAFSIALYLIGFAESFNGYFGFDTSINGLRLAGSIALLVLTAIALISTSVALKTQFFILAAIVISLVSITMGTTEFAPASVTLFSDKTSVPLEVVFAIFFPAVTGFTAGVAMSGDLKNPKKSLPLGTIAAIGVGFIVYISLAFFLAYYINSDTLKSDYNILMKIALYAPAVVAGIWGATLSSALGGILGAPRILQAMSIDKVTPKFFGKGKGKNEEPVNALIFVFVIAQAGILIGELDVIARVVSMFYLAAYGFINLSFFLESWANPDFQPSFKVNRWFGLLGFIASFGIMFKLDMLAMFGAIIIIIGIYLLLQRKQLALDSGDVWQSVWENIVAKGLKKLDDKKISTHTNWNPNIILFSGESNHQKYLLDLSNTISGRTGIVTNFKLILDKNGSKPLSRSQQIVKDDSFKNLGIFARQVKVKNIFKGIENIASTFGFTGVEPNTVMMGWPRMLNKSEDYNKMTQTLLHLDYNLLYLDFDQNSKFGNYQSVDLWWRETDSKNAEMMLNIVRFIIQSPSWNKAKIRVLFVNHNNVESNLIHTKISELIEELRVKVEIVVINNGVEQKPFYEIISIQSAKTDLTLIGIPNIKTEKQAQFIVNTTQLFDSIGSTLMVKAANNFNELQFDLAQVPAVAIENNSKLKNLPTSNNHIIDEKVLSFNKVLFDSLDVFSNTALTSVSGLYMHLIEEIKSKFISLIRNLKKSENTQDSISYIQSFIRDLILSSSSFREHKLQTASQSLYTEINKLQKSRIDYIENSPKKIILSKNNRLKWKAVLEQIFTSEILPNTQKSLYTYGAKYFVFLNNLTKVITEKSNWFIENTNINKNNSIDIYQKELSIIFRQEIKNIENIQLKLLGAMQFFERNICIELVKNIEKPKYYTKLVNREKSLAKKSILEYKNNISWYGTHWYKNQVLAHNQTETGWHLFISALSLSKINENIKFHLFDSLIKPQSQKIKTLSHASKTLSKEKNTLDKQINLNIQEIAKGISQVALIDIFEDEEKSINQLSQNTSDYVKLIHPDSLNVLSEQQNDALVNINLNIATIQNHIIQHEYLAKLQDNLVDFEKSFNQNSEAIYNTANRIIYLLDEQEVNKHIDDKDNLIKEIENNINTNQLDLNKLSDLFILKLKTDLHRTHDNLDIRKIIESADLLEKASHKLVSKSKFEIWITQKKSSFVLIKNNLLSFINQQQQEVDKQIFEDTHIKYANTMEQTYNFIRLQQVKETVANQLPFYYKKLFTGSHLPNANIKDRIEYQTALNAIRRVDSGDSGAIIIIGKSLSGKTFLSDAIAKTPNDIIKHDINPPNNQNFTATDLDHSFQKVFQKKGTALSIIKNLKKRRVFVFNDIERWWTRNENGGKCIDYLSDLIIETGNKHLFILNGNQYAYSILKETSKLEKSLLATIIMRPYTKNELYKIILNRHRIGGAKVYYKDDLICNSRKTKKLISKIHNQSNQTIGVSLRKWIAEIALDKEDSFIIKEEKTLDFPTYFSANWKLLMFSLLIHQTFSKIQIKQIFNEDHTKYLAILVEMEKSNLVVKQSDAKYKLNDLARHYVEIYLENHLII
jgi:amino acid transporter